MGRIWIAEDDTALAGLLADYLIREGHVVRTSSDGQGFLDLWQGLEKPDLVILDIMMPQRDGLSLLRQIRLESEIPVILITAMDAERDQLRGFSEGAQDYVVKPFSPKILVARVKALLGRRSQSSGSHTYGQLEQDRDARRFFSEGQVLDLKPKEYDLLEFFCLHQGQALSREQLLQGVWKNLNLEDTRTVDTHVKRLRQKLGPRGEYIQTVWSYGYRFEAKP